MTRAGEDLVNGTPEAERAVADCDLVVMASPRRFTSTSSSRQLWALSQTPTWKPTSSFPSGMADRHEHVLGLIRRSSLQVHPVRPDVDGAARRGTARLPAAVLFLPRRGQPRHHRGREFRRVLSDS